ncbi:apoptosis-inducing factor 2, partial [Phenoliferia sp. Uapishka_3]
MADSLKNVVVVGGSYVGLATAQELVSALSPDTYRVLVIEKNSHFSHLFAFPRFALTKPGLHEHKAFIPFASVLRPPHSIVQAAALSISPTTVTLDRPIVINGVSSNIIPFEALVMATGTALSPPGTLPGTTKQEGVDWFQEHQARVEKAKNIVIIGGGAVGVQTACDIPILFSGSSKSVTLVHSRKQLMPRFHPALSDIVQKRFDELGVKTVLGSRAVVPEGGWESVKDGGKILLEDGREVEGDLIILTTGQTPLSSILKDAAPAAINANGFVKVKPSFQVDAPGFERVYAVGDIADSGAPKAARPGGVMAGVVARNVQKALEGKTDAFEAYVPDPAAIHLTLGINESIIFINPPSSDPKDPLNTFVGEPTVTWKDDGREDMGIEGVWERRAPGVKDFKL